MADKSDEQDRGRGHWDTRLQFTMICIATALGLADLWRFPMLVFQYGGGMCLTLGIHMNT